MQRFVVFARLTKARWVETESEAKSPRRASVCPPWKANSPVFTGAAAASAWAAASGVMANGRSTVAAFAAFTAPAAQRAIRKVLRTVLSMRSPDG